MNYGAPATLRLLLTNGNPTAVDPLHCTTVPFSLAAAVNARVEVMSARVVVGTTVGLAVFVRVVTKSKSSHCKDATLLQSNLLPMVSVLLKRMRALAGRNGSTTQSRKNPWLIVQVKVAISPGQAPLIPTLESRTTVAAHVRQHSDITWWSQLHHHIISYT